MGLQIDIRMKVLVNVAAGVARGVWLTHMLNRKNHQFDSS
jgi:hypothetical protein